MELSKTLKDTLLGSNSIKALSKSSGADESKVREALSDALPVLLNGMHKNASTKNGEKSLSKALSDHAGNDTSDIMSFLKNVDTEDGQKIISHILGGGKETLESKIADKSGLKSGQISTILATAAPLLLNLIGKKKKDDDEKDSGGILSILGSALGGSGKDNDLGDVLASGIGSLLGGKDDKKKKDDDNGLGGILADGLGSLLGGADDKKKPSSKKKKPASKKPAAGKKKPSSKKKK